MHAVVFLCAALLFYEGKTTGFGLCTVLNKMECRGKIIFFQLMGSWFEDILGYFFPLELLSLVAFLILSIFLQSQLSKNIIH